jgi:uncharacterized membrane protein YkvA (DUF1232 family)
MKVRANLGFGAKLYRYVKDPSVALWRKLAGVGALAYLVMPLDVIPDVLPLVGWLDDVGVLGAATMFVVREVKRHAAQHQAPVAPEQP